jgi:hypothetical protein
MSLMALRTQSGALLERVQQAASVTSGKLLDPNSERSGLQITADQATAYLRLYTGADGNQPGNSVPTVSAANADIFIPLGGSWPGTVGGVVWTGGVAVISGAATGTVIAVGT